MNFTLKSFASTFALILGLLLTTPTIAQTSCCDGEAKDKTTCTTEQKTDKKASCDPDKATAKATSGCLPSSCRGAQTKFGEAKVISNLQKAKKQKKYSKRFKQYCFVGLVG